MAVSDLNLVRHLIRATGDEQERLHWRRHGPGGFRAQLNGVRLSLFHAQFREGSRLGLALSKGNERACIVEPRNDAPFGSKYSTEEDRLLAESLQLLMECVAVRCIRPEKPSWEPRDSIRDALFNRILPG